MAEACRALGAAGHRGQRQPLQRERWGRHRPHARSSACSAWSRRCARAARAGLADGDALVLLGPRAPGASAIRWRGRAGPPSAGATASGTLPALDLAAHRAVCEFVAGLVAARWAATTPARWSRPCTTCPAAAWAWPWPRWPARSAVGCFGRRWASAAELFCETARRASWWPPTMPDELCARAGRARWASRVELVGRVIGDRFGLGDVVDLPLEVARRGLRGQPGRVRSARPVSGPGCGRIGPRVKEACGVFGIYAPDARVANLTFDGLYALQHRGQESAGMAVSDGDTVMVVKDMGLVATVFDERTLVGARRPPGHRPHPLLHPRRLGLGRRPAGLPARRAGPASPSATTAT